MSQREYRRRRSSRAFNDLKGTVAANLSAAQYDELVGAAFIEESNTQLLKDISLVGGSKQSPGGPRAGTSKVVVDVANDTGSRVIFIPSQGETWLLQEMVMTADTSGTWTFNLDYVVTEETQITIPIIPTTSKTDTHLLMSKAFGWPTANTYLDENTTVFMTFGGSFTSINIYLLLTRYR